MKQPNRAELTMAPKPSTESTLKPQRRTKDTQPKAPVRSKPAAPPPKSSSSCGAVKTESLPSSPVSAEELAAWAWTQEAVAWDVVAECWWRCGGVEDEKLLGWFPFGEEDFQCVDSKGVEDGDEWCHDIWELQHINEVPSGGK